VKFHEISRLDVVISSTYVKSFHGVLFREILCKKLLQLGKKSISSRSAYEPDGDGNEGKKNLEKIF
jgi:hypothetical protein